MVDTGFSPRIVRHVPNVIARRRSTIGEDTQGHTYDRAAYTLYIEAQVTPQNRGTISAYGS